jgi:hypothetical protein
MLKGNRLVENRDVGNVTSRSKVGVRDPEKRCVAERQQRGWAAWEGQECGVEFMQHVSMDP